MVQQQQHDAELDPVGGLLQRRGHRVQVALDDVALAAAQQVRDRHEGGVERRGGALERQVLELLLQHEARAMLQLDPQDADVLLDHLLALLERPHGGEEEQAPTVARPMTRSARGSDGA